MSTIHNCLKHGLSYNGVCASCTVLQAPPTMEERRALDAAIATHKVSLSERDDDRAMMPMANGLLDYFPNALAYVAEVSKRGSDKHNPGEEMHWARGKSTDHANKIMRHLVDRGRFDENGVRHSGNLAWRALALLQQELEETGLCPPSRASKF